MKEIWKDIVGYEGLYQVSNLGRVKSYKRMGTNGGILKKSFFKQGYEKTILAKNNKLKTFKTHRLVAIAFIPNQNNFPQVNHKDGNKLNNCVDNLEWTTAKENTIHAHKNNLCDYTHKMKPIAKIKNGIIIETFKCIHNVKRKYGYATSNICKAAKGILKTAYGFVWKYL